jgi:hypothetical protein
LRRIIKHANRRLYDAEKRRATTLLELSDLALDGTQIAVVDKASGEDITALVLIQSILERLRRGPAGGICAADARRLLDALSRAIAAGTEGSGLFEMDTEGAIGDGAPPEGTLSGHAGTTGGAA